MSNRHCGYGGCVLSPYHINIGTAHADAAGNRIIDSTPVYFEDMSKRFRSKPWAEIVGSLGTEFSSVERDILYPLLRKAKTKDEYLLYYVWGETRKLVREANDPAQMLTTCLQRHGLDVTK